MIGLIFYGAAGAIPPLFIFSFSADTGDSKYLLKIFFILFIHKYLQMAFVERLVDDGNEVWDFGLDGD